MKVLTEAKQSQYRAMLDPLVVAYEEWIKLEKSKLNDPSEDLEHFQMSLFEPLPVVKERWRESKKGSNYSKMKSRWQKPSSS